MKQDAKRNLHRRKRQALRLARKAYFKKLNDAADSAATASQGAASPPRS